MESSKYTRVSFRAVCLVATFLMLLRGTIKYNLDESVSIVDTKDFHGTKNDIYPVFTLCLEMDFKHKSFDDPRHTLPLYSYSSEKNKDFKMTQKDIQEYVYFTMGIRNSEKTFNYDNITVDVTDYLADVIVESGNNVVYKWEGDSAKQQPLFISYRHPLIKCFSLDLSALIMANLGESKTVISHLSIRFSNYDPTLKLFGSTSEMLWANFMHYPKQLMRSTALDREHLGMLSDHFSKSIYVDSVEVIRRRNTHIQPCDENYKQEDDMIIKRLAEREGCLAPYWMVNGVDYQKPCTNASEMSNLLTPDLNTIDPKFLGQFQSEEPCSQVYGISYTVKKKSLPSSCMKNEPISGAIFDHHPSEERSQHQQEGGKILEKIRSQVCMQILKIRMMAMKS